MEAQGLWTDCCSVQAIKLNSRQDLLKLINDLTKKKQIKEPKEESKSGVPVIKELNKSIFASTYDIYSDEILKKLKSSLLKTTPQWGYIISTDSWDICLTVNLKNKGKITWPKGFRVKTLNTDQNAIESKSMEITILLWQFV